MSNPGSEVGVRRGDVNQNWELAWDVSQDGRRSWFLRGEYRREGEMKVVRRKG